MSDHATLRDAIIHFSDFEHCRQFMVDLRWADGKVKCPECGSEKVCYLAKNRLWKCYSIHPKPRFTLKTGTIFEDSPIPLEKWLPAVWMLLNLQKRYFLLGTSPGAWRHPKDRLVYAPSDSACHAEQNLQQAWRAGWRGSRGR